MKSKIEIVEWSLIILAIAITLSILYMAHKDNYSVFSEASGILLFNSCIAGIYIFIDDTFLHRKG